ncbi:MAG: ROK family protein [Candidatus Limnocylindrales bacterium]|jgi:predicted NBD/HSP70 family sugar kinase
MDGRATQPESLEPFLVAPRVAPQLDAAFRPAVLARRALAEAVRRSGQGIVGAVAIEQPGAAVCAADVFLFAEGHPAAAASRAICERVVKSLLWSHGGSRVWVDGPPELVDALRRHYAEDATGRWDAQLMGNVIYGRTFEVVASSRSRFPISRETTTELGRHFEGSRIGFDLGASDRKAAAVIDGEVVFSEEIPWDPSRHDDPQWHYDQIMDSLRRAAEHLPHVDAIGGSAAGIYTDSQIRVASLFRSVRPDVFKKRVPGLFAEMRQAWGGIPFVVVNDGEVTALAGAMHGGVGGLLGIAMGSSQAAGYVTREGDLTSWLNELAFVPIDYAPAAPLDEWSGDRGCGVQYMSQQAVGRLLIPVGIEADPRSPLPERLLLLQHRMAGGDERAARVYETIGTYLGYALLDYRDIYDFDNVLVLGRVVSGPGGDLILARAREVLASDDAVDPAAAGSGPATITFHTVSERDKRHGQAVAAASLPALEG